MSTQFYNNRQAPTSFSLTDAVTEVDVLATAANTQTYQEGMSVNGGGVLHLEVDASGSGGNIGLKGYRRLTSDAEWSLFYTAAVAGEVVFTDRVADLYGYADVRITATGDASGAQPILVSATIFAL